MNELLFLVLIICSLNCVFCVLGFYAGKHFRIIEIKQNEEVKVLEQDNNKKNTIKRSF